MSTLDERVAMEVMGWHKEPNPMHKKDPVHYAPERWMLPNGDISGAPSRYSTDISAAWLVVERMRELGFTLRLREFESGHFSAKFVQDDIGRDFEAWDHTAAGAICLAALAAVGVDAQ